MRELCLPTHSYWSLLYWYYNVTMCIEDVELPKCLPFATTPHQWAFLKTECSYLGISAATQLLQSYRQKLLVFTGSWSNSSAIWDLFIKCFLKKIGNGCERERWTEVNRPVLSAPDPSWFSASEQKGSRNHAFLGRGGQTGREVGL